MFVYLNFSCKLSSAYCCVENPLVIALFKGKVATGEGFTLGTYFIVIHSAPHLSFGLITGNIAILDFCGTTFFCFMVVYKPCYTSV